MTDDDAFELSRRKALAGLGTIGVASAGAGLGTSAFFSDEETFTNNQLTAGELDLKVDWEEHYSDWSDDEASGLSEPVLMSDPGSGSGYLPLPDPMFPLLWVHNSDLDQFMDNTAIEAMPDTDNTGIQDDLSGIDVCAQPWDTPEVLDPRGSDTLASGPRTNNGATEDATLVDDGTGMVPAPLINLNDVKPGDFGELTLSFHLCDNDGYVWLTGDPVSAAENGHTEPEEKDTDSVGPSDETASGQAVLDSDVELLDAVRTTLWYDDDGDNVIDMGLTQANPADVMIVFDRSGSMDNQTNKFQNAKDGAKALVNSLGSAANVGLVSFDGSATLDESLGTAGSTVNNTIDNLSASGSTNIGDAINLAQSELAGGSTGNPIMVLISNGGSNTGPDPVVEANNAKGAGTTIFGIAYGSGANELLIEDIATGSQTPDGIGPEDPNAFFGTVSTIQSVFQNIGQVITGVGEEIFFRGSLRDALTELSSDNGIPLDGDRSTDFAETADPDNADSRECFDASDNHFIGFAWYLPVDHANEIQGDSVSFDLGFYTEQCRHNDGAGQTQAQP